MEQIHILLVEDNDGDIMLTEEALQESGLPTVLSIARDGQEAIDFLNREGLHADSPTPSIILLDINLPKKNGHEVLNHIKNTPALKAIPVIILTTSSSQNDVNRAYAGYANCYITKPVEVEDFQTVITTIRNFWSATARLPVYHGKTQEIVPGPVWRGEDSLPLFIVKFFHGVSGIQYVHVAIIL